MAKTIQELVNDWINASAEDKSAIEAELSTMSGSNIQELVQRYGGEAQQKSSAITGEKGKPSTGTYGSASEAFQDLKVTGMTYNQFLSKVRDGTITAKKVGNRWQVDKQGATEWKKKYFGETGTPVATSTGLPTGRKVQSFEEVRATQDVGQKVRIVEVLSGDRVRLEGGQEVRYMNFDAPDKGELGWSAYTESNKKFVKQGTDYYIFWSGLYESDTYGKKSSAGIEYFKPDVPVVYLANKEGVLASDFIKKETLAVGPAVDTETEELFKGYNDAIRTNNQPVVQVIIGKLKAKNLPAAVWHNRGFAAPGEMSSSGLETIEDYTSHAENIYLTYLYDSLAGRESAAAKQGVEQIKNYLWDKKGIDVEIASGVGNLKDTFLEKSWFTRAFSEVIGNFSPNSVFTLPTGKWITWGDLLKAWGSTPSGAEAGIAALPMDIDLPKSESEKLRDELKPDYKKLKYVDPKRGTGGIPLNAKLEDSAEGLAKWMTEATAEEYGDFLKIGFDIGLDAWIEHINSGNNRARLAIEKVYREKYGIYDIEQRLTNEQLEYVMQETNKKYMPAKYEAAGRTGPDGKPLEVINLTDWWPVQLFYKDTEANRLRIERGEYDVEAEIKHSTWQFAKWYITFGPLAYYSLRTVSSLVGIKRMNRLATNPFDASMDIYFRKTGGAMGKVVLGAYRKYLKYKENKASLTFEEFLDMPEARLEKEVKAFEQEFGKIADEFKIQLDADPMYKNYLMGMDAPELEILGKEGNNLVEAINNRVQRGLSITDEDEILHVIEQGKADLVPQDLWPAGYTSKNYQQDIMDFSIEKVLESRGNPDELQIFGKSGIRIDEVINNRTQQGVPFTNAEMSKIIKEGKGSLVSETMKPFGYGPGPSKPLVIKVKDAAQGIISIQGEIPTNRIKLGTIQGIGKGDIPSISGGVAYVDGEFKFVTGGFVEPIGPGGNIVPGTGTTIKPKGTTGQITTIDEIQDELTKPAATSDELAGKVDDFAKGVITPTYTTAVENIDWRRVQKITSQVDRGTPLHVADKEYLASFGGEFYEETGSFVDKSTLTYEKNIIEIEREKFWYYRGIEGTTNISADDAKWFYVNKMNKGGEITQKDIDYAKQVGVDVDFEAHLRGKSEAGTITKGELNLAKNQGWYSPKTKTWAGKAGEGTVEQTVTQNIKALVSQNRQLNPKEWAEVRAASLEDLVPEHLRPAGVTTTKVGLPIQDIEITPADKLAGQVGEVAEGVVGKEPWQMTSKKWGTKIKSEYEREYGVPFGEDTKLLDGRTRIEASHYKQVEQALAEGKPVPPEVLAEYPDLAAEVPTSKKLAGQVGEVAEEVVTPKPTPTTKMPTVVSRNADIQKIWEDVYNSLPPYMQEDVTVTEIRVGELSAGAYESGADSELVPRVWNKLNDDVIVVAPDSADMKVAMRHEALHSYLNKHPDLVPRDKSGGTQPWWVEETIGKLERDVDIYNLPTGSKKLAGQVGEVAEGVKPRTYNIGGRLKFGTKDVTIQRIRIDDISGERIFDLYDPVEKATYVIGEESLIRTKISGMTDDDLKKAGEESVNEFLNKFSTDEAFATRVVESGKFNTIDDIIEQFKSVGRYTKEVANVLKGVKTVEGLKTFLSKGGKFLALGLMLPDITDPVTNIPMDLWAVTKEMNKDYDVAEATDWMVAPAGKVIVFRKARTGLGGMAINVWDTIKGILGFDVNLSAAEFNEVRMPVVIPAKYATPKELEDYYARVETYTNVMKMQNLTPEEEKKYRKMTTIPMTITGAVLPGYQRTYGPDIDVDVAKVPEDIRNLLLVSSYPTEAVDIVTPEKEAKPPEIGVEPPPIQPPKPIVPGVPEFWDVEPMGAPKTQMGLQDYFQRLKAGLVSPTEIGGEFAPPDDLYFDPADFGIEWDKLGNLKPMKEQSRINVIKAKVQARDIEWFAPRDTRLDVVMRKPGAAREELYPGTKLTYESMLPAYGSRTYRPGLISAKELSNLGIQFTPDWLAWKPESRYEGYMMPTSSIAKKKKKRISTAMSEPPAVTAGINAVNTALGRY